MFKAKRWRQVLLSFQTLIVFCEFISHLLDKKYHKKLRNKKVIVLFYTSEPPKDDGGAEITKYVVELSEGLSGM